MVAVAGFAAACIINGASKNSIFCATPFSTIVKSSGFRSEMYLPFLSFTITSMLTRLDLTLTTSSSWPAATNEHDRTIRRRAKYFMLLTPANSKRVSHAVDVIEPRRDQRNLQDALIVETNRA